MWHLSLSNCTTEFQSCVPQVLSVKRHFGKVIGSRSDQLYCISCIFPYFMTFWGSCWMCRAVHATARVVELVSLYLHFALSQRPGQSALVRFELCARQTEKSRDYLFVLRPLSRQSRCEHWSDASPTCLSVYVTLLTICMCALNTHEHFHMWTAPYLFFLLTIGHL